MQYLYTRKLRIIYIDDYSLIMYAKSKVNDKEEQQIW